MYSISHCTLTTLHCSKYNFFSVVKCEGCTHYCAYIYIYIYIYIYHIRDQTYFGLIYLLFNVIFVFYLLPVFKRVWKCNSLLILFAFIFKLLSHIYIYIYICG